MVHENGSDHWLTLSSLVYIQSTRNILKQASGKGQNGFRESRYTYTLERKSAYHRLPPSLPIRDFLRLVRYNLLSPIPSC